MKPTLLIMAAGIGSRYGTLKQIDRLGPSGETIIDYSVYDAVKAGIEKVVFVIRKDIEKDFQEVIINKLKDHIDVDYVFQEMTDVPQGSFISKDRIKPWGTGHAIWSARKKINEPFIAINADDFYGLQSFLIAADFLYKRSNTDTIYCNIGYILKNTLSDHGYVSRGELIVDDQGYMSGAFERTHVKRTPEGTHYQDDDANLIALPDNTVVSMNMWGFTPTVFGFLKQQFEMFVNHNALNPKAEFVIPEVINHLITNKEIKVKVLPSQEQWFGMTYKEDRQLVIKRIREMVEKGIYPKSLWK